MLNFFVNNYGCDRQDLLNEKHSAMIRACVRAFIEAEDYVRQKLKKEMYWLKSVKRVNNLNNLPDDFFPVPSWFYSDSAHENAAEYAKKMNINPEIDAVETIQYATVFLNWDNPAYSSLRGQLEADPGQIIRLHDAFVNKPCPDAVVMLNELIRFFESCVSGENDKLLYRGTVFDKTVKERESYIEPDETEEVELSPEEVKARLHKILPKPEDGQNALMPEISALDREIFDKAGITPVYDGRGKLVLGRSQMAARKTVYLKDKYPKYVCDTCRVGMKCPEYKPGYVCAFQKTFEQFDTRKVTDIISAMQTMVEYNVGRMQKAMLEEVMSGEIANPAVSGLINQNMALLSNLNRLYSASSLEVLRQTRVVHPDGRILEQNELVNPREGGILAKLFSDSGSKKANSEAHTPDEEAPPLEKKAGIAYQDEDGVLGQDF
jgi:hypothetical protein